MVAQKLNKPVIKKLTEEKSMLSLKIILGQQVHLKWDHCLLSIVVLSIYYVAYVFLPNMFIFERYES